MIRDDAMNQAKELFYDSMLYAMEGKDPQQAIDNLLERGMKRSVLNFHIPIRVNHIPNRYRSPITSEYFEIPYKERAKIAKDNKRKFTMDQYARMGITVIKEVDDYLCEVRLPEGWNIRAADSLWSDIFDDKGRKRISYFYKGAMWDTVAFSNFLCRYSISILPFDDYLSDATYEDRMLKPWSVYLMDCGEKVKKLHEITPTTKKEFYEVEDKLRVIGLNYLSNNYPDYDDINAYWGD